MHFVDRDRKPELLIKLISEGQWKQVLVFTRTKHGANRLAERLNKADIATMAIHGDKGQNARTKALADFKAGGLQVLVATDIAARGIDIDQLPFVVNYDLPNTPEDYVHRIGRTGRAGSNGAAVSFVTVDETNFLADIEKLTKQKIPREDIAGFEANMNAPAEPVTSGRQVMWGAPKPRGWVAPPKAPMPSRSHRNAGSGGNSRGGNHAGNKAGGNTGGSQGQRQVAGARPATGSPANHGNRAAPVNGNRAAPSGPRPGSKPNGGANSSGRTQSFGKLR